MKTASRLAIASCLLLLLNPLASADAAEIRVAVASNFTGAMRQIARQFEQRSGHRVILAFGSTGKHYTQIRNGAPFDAYFAADSRHPRLLEKEGVALPGSRFTYAVGKLVLWSPLAGYVDSRGRVLEQGTFRHLALANPRLAPYGKAAREVLEKLGLWQPLQARMVRGENIGQAFQFVASGNAELGLVALSQISHGGKPLSGSWWEIPAVLYSPIEQQAVLLKEDAAAREFIDFVRSDAARKIIASYGYALPDAR